MNDNKQVSLYDFKGHQVRVVELDGNPWFAGMDICAALGLANASNAYNRLAEDQRSYIRRVDVGLNPGRDLMFVSESGLYKLVLRSRKPDAEAFKTWVTREVLPSIRKNGGYIKDQEKVVTGRVRESRVANYAALSVVTTVTALTANA